jgi:hypothetical protein
MKKFLESKTVLIVGLYMIILPLVSHAQFNFNASPSDELNVQVIPTYPKPNDTVSISLSMYSDDLSSADISWYKDGKKVLSGKGETNYSFQTGKTGQTITIEIRVTPLNGSSFSKTLTLSPAGADIVWEASSYVPPFYKGKASHPKQGLLKIVALTDFVKNGKVVSPKNLTYEWSGRSGVYQNQSGYGKNVLILNGSLLGKEENVSVLVTDPGSNLVAQNSITVTPTDPKIIFYENNPYYGHNFDTAVQSGFTLNGEELQVLATPFGFTKEGTGGLKFEWRLNGQSVPALLGSRTAIFRKPEGAGGQSSVSLNIENQNRVLQQASGNFSVKFGE